ncbi:WG repeat-containing protein [Sphingobacterium paramultivorum]|uniref:WG repeat-containing protein n=1 Tax=Sphingobacterium paramultivorum TaxID=2886510 RepID=A0A7G5E2T5_9SPHI|nr:SEL1-like repeat protein [Sphingobacterium paramultivorum]QMV68310.1 WG repeat-containing protein [Sphingobacterium paramultivorum]WSO17231.1 WG repeat-containing protein [Sphingobacterium paramultivorum]
MAHRIYIYNTDKKDQDYFPHYLGEWNYVIPPLFLPLFAANPKAKGTLVYSEKEPGIRKLRAFYDLLIHEYRLNSDALAMAAIGKLFDFLDGLPFDYFQLNASDVFNMSDVKHSQQAKDFAFEIYEKNLPYEKAIEKQSLAELESILAPAGYTSFLAMLELEWGNYGLGWWNSEAIDSLDNQFFEDQGFWGIRNAKGEVKVEASYQEIGDFDYEGIAVIKKNDLFGYLNRGGEETIPCIYSSAAPAQYGVGSTVGKVSLAKKYGLINVGNGEIIIPLEYDELEDFAYGYYQGKKDQQYYIIDAQGQFFNVVGADKPFDIDYDGFIYQDIPENKLRHYYSNRGILLGAFASGALSELLFDFYAVNLNNKKKKSVLSPDGTILVKDVDILNAGNGRGALFFADSGSIRLYNLEARAYVLQDLVMQSVQGGTDFGNGAWDCYIIETAAGSGIYQAAEKAWLIPLSTHYVKIVYAAVMDYFILKDYAGRYYYFDAVQRALSSAYDYVCASINHYQDLMLLQGDLLYKKGYDGVEVIQEEQYGQFLKKLDQLSGEDFDVCSRFFERWKTAKGDNFESSYDSYTLYHMALDCYRQGDVEKAMRYFTFSADQGNESSMHELGNIFTDTDSEDNRFLDLDRGIQYYEQAAQKEYAPAWNAIGYLFQYGIGYNKDLKKSFDAYMKGAELGNGYALSNLGYFYSSGTYVEEDLEKALTYYQKAELKLVENNSNIASIYYSLEDYDRLLVYLKRDKENSYSNIYYGLLYDQGLKFKKDSKKAIHYFERANDYGVYESATARLLDYYKNDPTFRNQEKFVHWLGFAKTNELDIEQDLLQWDNQSEDSHASSSFFSKLFKKKK